MLDPVLNPPVNGQKKKLGDKFHIIHLRMFKYINVSVVLSWDSWCVLIDKLGNHTDQRALWSGKIKGPALNRWEIILWGLDYNLF